MKWDERVCCGVSLRFCDESIMMDRRSVCCWSVAVLVNFLLNPLKWCALSGVCTRQRVSLEHARARNTRSSDLKAHRTKRRLKRSRKGEIGVPPPACSCLNPERCEQACRNATRVPASPTPGPAGSRNQLPVCLAARWRLSRGAASGLCDAATQLPSAMAASSFNSRSIADLTSSSSSSTSVALSLPSSKFVGLDNNKLSGFTC